MKTQVLSAEQMDALESGVAALLQGRLIAFPTDTVYGLGALPHQPRSIQQLYRVKGREASKAIPILISDPDQLNQVVAEVNPRAQRLIERFWPGPLTLVLPKHPSLPAILTPQATIGVRIPDHPLALKLLRLSGPLAVTSANLSGKPSCTTAEEVLAQLGGRIPLILDGGRTPGGIPSTVVDCTGLEPNILRPGPISLQEIMEALS